MDVFTTECMLIKISVCDCFESKDQKTFLNNTTRGETFYGKKIHTGNFLKTFKGSVSKEFILELAIMQRELVERRRKKVQTSRNSPIRMHIDFAEYSLVT